MLFTGTLLFAGAISAARPTRRAAGGSGIELAGHGVVNLCLAATLPAARRRGVWGALVWARVDDHPELPAMAFTSDDSRPGFEHLGFLVVTRCTLWARSGPLNRPWSC